MLPPSRATPEKIILPGVGAFADAIAELKRRELVAPIRASIDAGKPFLGICLGLQLLFDRSLEDGDYEGLGILPGEVRRFDIPSEYKVPHMGWNRVQFKSRPPIFAGLEDEPYFYFVHSYYVVPEANSDVVGEASYPDRFCAAIWRDNLYATQFHPEKSQANGLRVLKNFAELA